jgi:hypothetical protein
MDIEGGEYVSLGSISQATLNRFRILVVEFHRLDSLWDEAFFNIAASIFRKILQNHLCVHIHPNNCCGIENQFDIPIPRIAEFTFLRKDRARFTRGPMAFPHALDWDNTGNETLVLPKIWYKND